MGEIAADMTDDFDALRARGASADLIEAIAAAGVPAAVVRRAVEQAGFFGRLRLLINRRAPLSVAERARLVAVADQARAVADSEGGFEGARRFWTTAMPWLGGRTPADCLARGEIGAVAELRARIDLGIPP